MSFVRRSSRMRPNQRRAWELYRDQFVLEVPRQERSTSVQPDARLDVSGAFGRTATLIVEIGPGTGESLLPMAKARPDANLLAFEVYEPAIAQILAGLGRDGVTNVRLIQADAVEGLRHLLTDGAVEELWTFFPDPWPKARHHKRRLVNAEFVNLAATRIAPSGRWRLATDWEDYAESMRALLNASGAFVQSDLRGAERPVTRFEQRGLAEGRRIVDLAYRRLESP